MQRDRVLEIGQHAALGEQFIQLAVQVEQRRRHQALQLVPTAFRALAQRLVGELLQRLQGVAALLALVFVDRHTSVSSLVNCGARDYTVAGKWGHSYFSFLEK